MIYLIIGPLGIYFFFRVMLPIIWCSNFLITNGFDHKYSVLVLIHLLYLVIEGLLTIYLMVYINNKVAKYRVFRDSQEYVFKKNKEAEYLIPIVLFLILIFLIFEFKTLPIFLKNGSNAIVLLGEKQKDKTWLLYGLSYFVSSFLLFFIIYIKSYKKKFIYIIILFSIAIVTGKKAALITIFSNLIFIYYIFSIKKPKFPFIKVGLGLLSGVIFALYQYSQTLGSRFNLILFNKLFNIISSSSTNYLAQIVQQGGIYYAPLYSKSLGIGGPIIYILNPFEKFIFGFGIHKSIGPFLTFVLYNYKLPFGVNPTLFFEYIFVYGSELAIPLAFINLILVFMLAKYFIMKVIYNFNKNILVTITFFGLFISCISFTLDTLNTIRELPFVLLPYLLFYFIKFLPKKKNREIEVGAIHHDKSSYKEF